MTRDIASDPSHPLYLRTQRRLQTFDPNILHWNVICPLDVSKKAVVRNWTRRRVKEAFKAELKARGLESDGKFVEDGRRGAKGALMMVVDKRKAAEIIQATGQEVREECGWVVRKILAMQPMDNLYGQPEAGLRKDSWSWKNEVKPNSYQVVKESDERSGADFRRPMQSRTNWEQADAGQKGGNNAAVESAQRYKPVIRRIMQPETNRQRANPNRA
ncbi:hypothetical protein LTR37_009558 [Vermiconidia calcicola]|uniref:Uncharacterized protein n=1 Tax=Vermiconidia calcicola TaxID=1690605 RepID=A0ACC3N875_9PEZI|nr:hypothetical protein LTR37_009558 [Vermiconidia calcicola]